MPCNLSALRKSSLMPAPTRATNALEFVKIHNRFIPGNSQSQKSPPQVGARTPRATMSHNEFRTRLYKTHRNLQEGQEMKYAGLLVMPAGFFLSIAALVLFPEPGLRGAFVFAGIVVEAMGLFVAVRGHMPRTGESRI